jgi:heat shock protein HtpX
MGGSFISLAISRIMAKMMLGVKVIDPASASGDAAWLVQTVHHLASAAGLPEMPQVGIYQSPELNAFATGPTKSRSLVAVSSGLLERMDRNQVEGVLGHEIAHVANGDMVTMTLLQGVVNAFVMFLAR